MRVLSLLTLLAGMSGCLRWGYEPVSLQTAHGAHDAGPPDASLDAGSARPDAGSFMEPTDASGPQLGAGTPADAGAPMDAAEPMDARAADAAVSDAGVDASVQDAASAADGGYAGDAGAICPGAVNACGGCSALSDAPGSACGTCGLGSNICDGPDALTCVGGAATPTTVSGTLLVDDFEDSDRQFHSGSIRGQWYLITDSTSGVLNPATDDGLVPTGPGAHNSQGALHVSGSGFMKWGAGFQGSLNLEGCYVNASAQAGVSFYARGTGTVQIMFATRQTVPTVDGGSCVGMCYDNFATTFTLTSSWKPYQIPWSSLHQGGWGTVATFQASQLKFVQFSFAAGSSMDLYLDDVALY